MTRTAENHPVCFNGVFRKVNDSRARYRVMLGSAGSGKSFNIAQDYIVRLSDPDYRGANLLVVRRSEASNRDSTFAELCGAIRRVFGEDADKYWRATYEPLALESIVTGNRIIFRGMLDERQRERIKSVSFPQGKLCFIWCEEATELREADVDILDDRLRGDLSRINGKLYYQMTLTFNPVDGRHWIKRRFFDRADSDVLTHRSTYLDNAFIDTGYHRRMLLRSKTDPAGYRVYGLGEWGSCGGLILPDFKVAEQDGDASRYDFLSMGQDFGFNHADAILLCGFRDGCIHVLRELYVRGMDTGSIIDEAGRRGFFDFAAVPMYCDSAEPDRIKTWRDAGYLAEPVKKESGSILAQIDFLRAHGLEIDPSCENLIGELSSWSWLTDSVSGEPCDTPAPGSDDAIAALRYAVEGARKSGGERVRSIEKSALGL